MAKKPKWQPDPNVEGQEMRKIGPTTEVRNTPERRLLQISKARARGDVPLPPETLQERTIKEEAIKKMAAQPEAQPIQPVPVENVPIIPNQPEIMQPPTPSVSENQPLQPSNVQNLPSQQEIDTSVYPAGSFPNKIASFFGRNAPQKKINVENIGGLVIKPIAEVYDFLYSLTQGGKSIKQIEAEKTLNSINADMQQDLALVKQGLKDPNELNIKIQVAEDALNRLEASVKGLGKLNLRYWLVDGKDVEKQAIISRDNLRSYRLQLAAAVAEFRINQANINYGLR